MNRREAWRKVLDHELRRWQAVPYERLLSGLNDRRVYEVEFESKKYQVETEILENAEQYLHVMLTVDDGSLPASLLPATDSFIRHKPSAGG